MRFVVAEGEWDGEEPESRSVHVEITYKPESPVDHVTYPAAAQALWEVDELAVTYCGCSYSVVIHESSSYYNQATEEDVKRNGGCYHAYEESGDESASASASASAGSSSSGRHIRGVKYRAVSCIMTSWPIYSMHTHRLALCTLDISHTFFFFKARTKRAKYLSFPTNMYTYTSDLVNKLILFCEFTHEWTQ